MCTLHEGNTVIVTVGGIQIPAEVDCALNVHRLQTGTEEVVWLKDPPLALARKQGDPAWHMSEGPHLNAPIDLELATA